jgi:hypothetical protein
MAHLGLNLANVEPDSGVPDPVPAAWYNVKIDETDVLPTSKNDGMYVKVVFVIMDGQFAGRKIFNNYNFENKNPIAEEIGKKQLRALGDCIGVIDIQDTNILHGKPMKIRVGISPAKGDYEASNNIKGYKNINDTSVGAPAGAAGPAGPAAPAGPSAPAGFAPQQTAVQAPPQPVAAPTPPPAAPAPAPVPAEPVKTMTATATAAYEAYKANGWTDEQLVSHGFMTITVPPPVAPAAPPPAGGWQPPAGATPVVAAAPGAPGAAAPWVGGQAAQ